MSINSFAIGPVSDPPAADASAHASKGSARQTPQARSESILEPSSQQENPLPQSNSLTAEIPQDEVQVQRDASDGEIVIRYLDRSGQVVLQIPSAQLLGIARATEQALERQAKARGDELEGDREGGRAHGH